jgi:hypothetical protein
MKRFFLALLFSVLCVPVFAFDYICSAPVRVFAEEPMLEYEFLSVDTNSHTEMITLGFFTSVITNGQEINIGDPRTIVNNTGLSEAVQAKMKQVSANVCMTVYSGSLIINILMPNGTYTTIIY